MKPKMFIASSSEQIKLAYSAQEGLEHDVEATVWSQGVFTLSKTTMASLLDELDASDFGMFIFAPDDVTAMRNETNRTIRDNVVFELGMFAGRLGSERCFMIVPHGVEDLHLPTDLLGLTPAQFDPHRQDGNMIASLGPACNRVRRVVAKLGRFNSSISVAETPSSQDGLCSDPDDCLTLIQSWMGARTASDNLVAMRYADIDMELKLTAGSARQYLEKAAAHWRYRVARKGKEVILFEHIRHEAY